MINNYRFVMGQIILFFLIKAIFVVLMKTLYAFIQLHSDSCLFWSSRYVFVLLLVYSRFLCRRISRIHVFTLFPPFKNKYVRTLFLACDVCSVSRLLKCKVCWRLCYHTCHKAKKKKKTSIDSCCCYSAPRPWTWCGCLVPQQIFTVHWVNSLGSSGT